MLFSFGQFQLQPLLLIWMIIALLSRASVTSTRLTSRTTSASSAFAFRGLFARTTISTTAMMMSSTSNNKVAAAAAASVPNKDKSCSHLIPAIDPKRQALLKENGVTIEPIEPVGARVKGLDVKTIQRTKENEELFQALEMEMANRGYLVFPDQGVMTPDEQISASCLFGGQEMHSTHGVHPATPDRNRHIFRLSNDQSHGILGVGPQWHNDGSFVEGTFSHVGYHIIRVPENGGGTYFAHQGGAFDVLPPEKQERWSRLVSVNSNSGVLHPVVHEHPISGRKSVWLHLGMTGAVIEHLPEGKTNYRLLNEKEMKELFNDYNDLLNDGVDKGYTINYQYTEGDLVMIDNLAVGHRASPEAHESSRKQGLRIMHRTTVAATQPFEPGFGLPQATDVYGPNPFGDDGVWLGGGIGFRWDDTIHMQN